MKNTISATEARKNFYELVRKASKPGAKIIITLEGEEPVIMMSQEEVESWMETLAVMSDPKLVQDIKEAERVKDFDSWDKVKRELGWD